MKNRTTRKLTINIAGRFIAVAVLFSVLLLAGIFIMRIIITDFFTFQGDEPLYLFFLAINDQLTILLPLTWLLGILIIFFYYWRITLGYIDLIAEKTTGLLTDENNVITLPDSLRDIEYSLNETKRISQQNLLIAKESEQRKNDLLVYLAHDLKTPLTSVIGYLTLLRDEKEISSELRQRYLSIANDKALRLEDLINEFFEITRMNLTTLSVHPQTIDLILLLQQMISEDEVECKKNRLEIRLISPDSIKVAMDPEKIERVFSNLLKNAMMYAYSNSTILIEVQVKDYLSITITNEADTLAKETLSHLFDQFYRADFSRGTKSGGSGLGLAIAKEIIEKHNGTISVHSENNHISFEISFAKNIVRNS